jgi:hypothetical protein
MANYRSPAVRLSLMRFHHYTAFHALFSILLSFHIHINITPLQESGSNFTVMHNSKLSYIPFLYTFYTTSQSTSHNQCLITPNTHLNKNGPAIVISGTNWTKNRSNMARSFITCFLTPSSIQSELHSVQSHPQNDNSLSFALFVTAAKNLFCTT